MDSHQISQAIRRRRDLPTSLFKGTFALNQIPSNLTPPFALVFNSETLSSPGRHWLALFCPAKGILEVFDTSGNRPMLEAESLLNLKNFVSTQHGCHLIYNPNQLQCYLSSVCGEWTVLFLYCRMKGMPFSTFCNHFSKSKLVENDLFVYSTVHSYFDIPKRKRAFPVFDSRCIQSSLSLQNVMSAS